MKTKSQKVLPKTAVEISNGGVYRQAIRCGRNGCRCAYGSLHEGYFYFIRRVGGRLRKTYVPKNEVEAFGKLVEQARKSRETNRAIRRSSRTLLSELRARLREYDPIIRKWAEALRQSD